jgi:hypothetical protein
MQMLLDSGVQIDRERISGVLAQLTAAIDDGSYREQHNRLYAARQALCWALGANAAASPYDVAMGISVSSGDCPAEYSPPQS